MIIFHRFLIATAILFSAGFGIWSLAGGGGGGVGGGGPTTLDVVLGVTFLVIAAGLSYYLKNLNRFLHR